MDRHRSTAHSLLIRVGGRICPPPEQVSELLADWLRDLRRAARRVPYAGDPPQCGRMVPVEAPMQPDRTEITTSDLREMTEAAFTVLDDLRAAYQPDRDLTPARRTAPMLVRVVAALFTETFESAEATRTLVQAGRGSSAWTCARRALEHAVTTAWLASDEGSLDAFVSEKGLRQSANLAKSIRDANLSVDSDLLDQVERSVPTRTEIERKVKNFEKISNTFSPKLYLVYRWACTYAHPAFSSVARVYPEVAERVGPPDVWRDYLMASHIAVSSVVWAGRALDGIARDKPMRRTLKDAARKLGISPVLYPGMPIKELLPM